jgi:hypothetical protein
MLGTFTQCAHFVLTLDLNNDNNGKYLKMCILNILLECAQISIMTITECIGICVFLMFYYNMSLLQHFLRVPAFTMVPVAVQHILFHS